MLNLSPEKFDTLDQEVRELLIARGFIGGRHERGGPFGSHLSEYNRGNERVAISYDGRDNAVWFSYSGGSADGTGTSGHLRQPLSFKFSGEFANVAQRIRERIQHAI